MCARKTFFFSKAYAAQYVPLLLRKEEERNKNGEASEIRVLLCVSQTLQDEQPVPCQRYIDRIVPPVHLWFGIVPFVEEKKMRKKHIYVSNHPIDRDPGHKETDSVVQGVSLHPSHGVRQRRTGVKLDHGGNDKGNAQDQRYQ